MASEVRAACLVELQYLVGVLLLDTAMEVFNLGFCFLSPLRQQQEVFANHFLLSKNINDE